MRSEYWSKRQGRGPSLGVTLERLARTLRRVVAELEAEGGLQEWYGYDCIDDGQVEGKARIPIGAHIEEVLGYRHAWPIPEDPITYIAGPTCLDDPVESWPDADIDQRAEDFLFDLIEFIYDHVSQGIGGRNHTFGACGMHYWTFESKPAQDRLRERLNPQLEHYHDGFELTEAGHIQLLGEDGLRQLLAAPVVTDDGDVQERVDAAVLLWTSRRRSPDDMRRAVRDLFDALEHMRSDVKKHMLKKDEQALFEIANNFRIRHHHANQRGDYDKAVWLSWIFYVNLATVHLVSRLAKRADPVGDGQ